MTGLVAFLATSLDLTRAFVELARARYGLTGWFEAELQNSAALFEEAVPTTNAQPLDPKLITRLDRIAWALPRVAARLPWRSDCIVQARAARHWLASHGIQSCLRLGVRNSPVSGFSAHAWVMVADRIVTGGDVTPFSPLTGTVIS
jgi:hypothetical protein